MTVTGTILNASGGLRVSTPLRFIPLSNPQAGSAGVLTAIELSTTTHATLGTFSIVLEEGFYEVAVGKLPRDRFRIQVPDSVGTADITTLMVSSLSPLNTGFRISGGWLQIKNVDTGLWHTIRISGQEGMEQLEILTGEA